MYVCFVDTICFSSISAQGVWVAVIRATVSPGFSMAHPPCVNPYGVTRDWSLRPVKPSWLLVIFGCLFAVKHRWVKTLALLQSSPASAVVVNSVCLNFCI